MVDAPLHDSFVAQADTIERVERLTPADFAMNFMGRSPVVITNAIDDWSAMRQWSLEHLQRACGHTPVRVLRHDPKSELSFYEQCAASMTTVPLAEYIDFVTGSADAPPELDGEPFLWTMRQSEELLIENPWLRKDFALDRLLGAYTATVSPSVWIGAKGYVTGLHADLPPIGLVAQIVGRKAVMLFSPEETKRLYPDQDAPLDGCYFSKIDSFAPDLDRHPRFAEANAVATVLEPGEVLYIPSGWWHRVLSLDVTISVTGFVLAPGQREAAELTRCRQIERAMAALREEG